jgi:hypothetical protein
MNPVISGFLEEPHYWKYSSAADYHGAKVILKLADYRLVFLHELQARASECCCDKPIFKYYFSLGLKLKRI